MSQRGKSFNCEQVTHRQVLSVHKAGIMPRIKGGGWKWNGAGKLESPSEKLANRDCRLWFIWYREWMKCFRKIIFFPVYIEWGKEKLLDSFPACGSINLSVFALEEIMLVLCAYIVRNC